MSNADSLSRSQAGAPDDKREELKIPSEAAWIPGTATYSRQPGREDVASAPGRDWQGSLLNGVAHHIVQRGNRREDVFFCDADRLQYINLLKAACEK